MVEEGEIVVDLFGQLWAIDFPPPPSKSRVLSQTNSTPNLSNLFWIQKELVEVRKFSPTDCFPVGKFDRLEKQPVQISFGEVWSREEDRRTYVEVLKRSMADEGCWVWQPEPQRPPPPRPQCPGQQQARAPPQ